MAQTETSAVVPANDIYGDAPLMMSQSRPGKKFTEVEEIDETLVGKTVLVRARLQSSRVKGKLGFLVLRNQSWSIQAVAAVDEPRVTKDMLKYIKSIPNESVIDVTASVTAAEQKVVSCSQQTVELQVQKVFVISRAAIQLPVQIADCERPEEDDNLPVPEGDAPRVNQDTRLDNRWIDLRTRGNHAVFRVQSAVCQLFREFLLEKGFMEIHTPKILGAASEGGSNIFELKYFDRKAFLAQSPQLCKQMAICSDFGKVFEIGPVFRAEQSFTHRHLTEFTGLDLEMNFKEHYHEALELMGSMFCYMFEQLPLRFGQYIDAVHNQYPAEPFVFRNPPLILTFADGVKLLNENGIKQDPLSDLGTPEEKALGALVKKVYNTDFYILDKFPASARPFYTMPDPSDPKYSNSYDMFLRGEEIVSGAQRIHDYDMLLRRVKECKIVPETLQAYLDSFKHGAAPHAGMGAGLERVTMLYLGLHNIRRTSLFPRDPKRTSP